MAEYIERERFIHHLEMCIDNVRNTNGVTEDFEICLRAFKNQPTADVAEIVRCKDCKHHRKDETGYWCNKSFNSFKTVEDNFCKFGAKMDKEG